MPLSSHPSLLQGLANQIQGEVLTDPLSRMLYATDASPYQQLPLGIVRPRSIEDCVSLVRFARRRRIALIPRAAGTSLAGQCVGKGLVVEVSRHLTKVLEIAPEQGRCRVQPGIVLDALNGQLRPWGLMFAPDPSTGSRCQIGGMIGNNAWGLHSLRDGTTRDHVLAVKAVLSDGSLACFGPLTPPELEGKLALDTLEGQIYRAVVAAVTGQRKIILERYPSVRGIPCNQGYPLDCLAQGQPWVAEGPLFNLAPFFCGTEGTLALIVEATLNLVSLPGERLLMGVSCHSLEVALRAVAVALEQRPVAVELLDRTLLYLARRNPEQAKRCAWIKGDPAAVLLIEFEKGETSLQRQGEALRAAFQEADLGEAAPVLLPASEAWAVRRAGLGLLMGLPGKRKAVSGIEDTAVAVSDLPRYWARIQAIMARHNLQCVVYGSAGRGVLHLRPELDLEQAADRVRFQKLMGEIADAVKEFGGVFSAKHGDGRLRAPFLERMLGGEIMALLSAIKQAADPEGLFNPGKILAPPPLLENLRAATETPRPMPPTAFDWSSDQGLDGAAARCNGAGVCLKGPGQGTMCPSYMATREEAHGTRGRANVFRQVLASSTGLAGSEGNLLHQVLDLCLACKGCKSECPAGVDVARLKAEFLHQYHSRHGWPRRARILGQFQRLAWWGARLPRVANRALASAWLRRLLDLHPQCRLPPLASPPFSARLRARPPSSPGDRRQRVVLVNDLWTEFFEPHIGMAALACLERLGYDVTVSPWVSSGRVQISQGRLHHARKVLGQAVATLYPYAAAGEWLLGLEPSELLTFRDEAMFLVPGGERRRQTETVASKALLFEEFIAREAEAGALERSLFAVRSNRVLVHGHCHQKALSGMTPLLQALALLPGATVESIPSGCCGMAGAFGYEREHYSLSREIGELVLFPAVRAASAEVQICAPGVSCRTQIEAGTRRRAYHPAELLQQALLSA